MSAKSNTPQSGRRELRVAEDVAQTLSAAHLAQLEAAVDDPDNRCSACERPITGATAEAVVFVGEQTTFARLAHSGCLLSAVYSAPGLQQQFQCGITAASTEMLTLLGMRLAEPRPLVFLEPALLCAASKQDPLKPFARLLGLSPVSGSVEELAPPSTDALTIRRCRGGLALRHPQGIDFAPAGKLERRDWLAEASGEALVILARGLGLDRVKPTIEEALRLRPTWAAVAPIEDVGAVRRLAGTLLRRAA